MVSTHLILAFLAPLTLSTLVPFPVLGPASEGFTLEGHRGGTIFSEALGNGRVSNVVAVDGGCVFQDSVPTNATETWDIQQGRTYQVTLTGVTDCANGGTDASIQVIVKSSNSGNVCLTASKQATGSYRFTVTLPLKACHTYPIVYCTNSCQANNGFLARRADGGSSASHLRAANFGGGCSNPTTDDDCTLGCSAWVVDLGGGCGAPAPTLHSTMPINGHDFLVSLTGAPAGVPLILAANAPPFPPSIALGGGCVLHVDPLTALILGPYLTTSNGDFYLSVALPLSLPPVSYRTQAAVLTPGGPLATAQITNGLEIRTGSCSPFCTYSPGSFSGAGSGAAIFDGEFEIVFASGLDVGVFDTPSGAASPNGLRWTGDTAGLTALETFLTGGPGPSGALTSDEVNPIGTFGGGSLAIQAATLALNIGFNAAGVLGGSQTNLGSIVYVKMDIPDALSGLTLSEILAAANQALAGNALPAGYTYDSLANFLEFLNVSFADCTMSSLASHRLYNVEGE